MNRILAPALLVLAVALPVAACDGENDVGAGASYAGGGGGYGDCSAYTTCGSCTPVDGCGWCFNASGGQCSPDPDSCDNGSEFTWTWDSTGCPGVDASVVPLDAGPGSTPPDTGAAETATTTPDTGASVPETGTTTPTDASAVQPDAH